MAALHYNLNLLTMVALTLSVGILVDDSIVVLENISRHLRMGKAPLQAAIDGRSEIGLAAITITLVDVVVYVPDRRHDDRLARAIPAPFALVITVGDAVFAAGVVHAHAAAGADCLLARGDRPGQRTDRWRRFGRAWDRGFAALEHRYERLLRVALPQRWLVIAVGLASFAAGIALLLFGFIGLDFFPSGDQSEIDMTLTTPPATSLEATNALATQVEHDLRATYPEVRSHLHGRRRSERRRTQHHVGGTNQAQITGLLVPPPERPAIVGRAGGGHAPAHWKVAIPAPRSDSVCRTPSASAASAARRSRSRSRAATRRSSTRLATQIQQAIQHVPGAVDVDNSNDDLQTQLRAKVDWTRAADLGVTARDAGAALRAALDGFTSNANQFRQSGSNVDSDPRSDRRRRTSLTPTIAAPAGTWHARRGASWASSPPSSRRACRPPSSTSTGCAA